MIFDILTTNPDFGQMDFLAASAPPNSLIVNGTGAGVVFENAFGVSWFESGDNLLISGIDLQIPFGFGQGPTKAKANFEFRDSIGASIIIPEFADTGNLVIPDTCHGLVYPGKGLFIKTPVGGSRLQLFCVSWEFEVSLVNLPTTLVGEIVQMLLHVTVQHTRPMQSVP